MSTDVTHLLGAAAGGDAAAMERVAALVYADLHALAVGAMRREVDGHTCQPTELVHEVFVRLVGNHQIAWRSRSHFFSTAARAMRRLLVDHARARKQQKRDGGERVPLTEDLVAMDGDVDLLELNDALDRLAALDPRQAQVVELRYFAGLTAEETAEALDVSLATVKRDWAVARAFLRAALTPDDGPAAD